MRCPLSTYTTFPTMGSCLTLLQLLLLELISIPVTTPPGLFLFLFALLNSLRYLFSIQIQISKPQLTNSTGAIILTTSSMSFYTPPGLTIHPALCRVFFSSSIDSFFFSSSSSSPFFTLLYAEYFFCSSSVPCRVFITLFILLLLYIFFLLLLLFFISILHPALCRFITISFSTYHLLHFVYSVVFCTLLF